MQQSEEDYDDGPEFEIVEAPPQVSGHKKARRAGKGRPDYWRETVDYYEDRLKYSAAHSGWYSAVEATLLIYDQEFKDTNIKGAYNTLRKWRKDAKADKEFGQQGCTPSYGKEIDATVLVCVIDRNSKGLSVDPSIMRSLLVTALSVAKKEDMLHENGGNYVFGDSWASRFLARHNLRRRVATTKMRERPADFAKKIADYIRIAASIICIAASIICMYGIPPELVIGCDETGCVFVPRSKYTIACKGNKRVRVLGIGKDKEQFTTTIFCTATGEVLDLQGWCERWFSKLLARPV